MHYSNRGKKVVDQEKRMFCISVRLNRNELDLLDSRRSTMQRGTFFRAALHGKFPDQILIPSINKDLYRDLGRALGNLATVATAMRGGEYREIDEIKGILNDFRLKLLTGKSEAEASYFHDSDENDE